MEPDLLSTETKYREKISDIDSKMLVLYLVFISAFLLRLYGLGDHSLWVDEAGTSSLVKTFLQDGIAQYPSGETSYRSMPLLISTAISTLIFGFNDFALRLPSAIAGTFTVILIFRWGKQAFDFRTGLLASTLIAVMPWHIALSQNARMYSLFQLAYFATFYFIYRYQKTRKDLYIILTALGAVLSLLTHVTGYILVVTLPAYVLITSDKALRDKIVPTGLLIIATTVTTELLYFDIVDVLERFTFSPSSAFQHLNWIFLNNTVLTSSGLVGLTILSVKKREVFGIFTTAIIPPSIVYMFFVELPASRYLFFIIPFLAITSSFLIYYLMGLGKTDLRKALPLIAILGVMFAGNPINPELGSHSPQPDFKSVYSQINNSNIEEETLIAGRPLPASHYFKKPDYVLIEQGLRESLISDGRELYSDSPIIENKTGLNKVLDSEDSGWIVASENVEKGIEPGLREEIQKLELVREERKIKLWRWR